MALVSELHGIHADADAILDQFERDKENSRLHKMREGPGEPYRSIPHNAFEKLAAESARLAGMPKEDERFAIFYIQFLTAWRAGEKGRNPVADYALSWEENLSATNSANGKKGGRPQKAHPPKMGRVALQNENENENERENRQPRKPKPKAKAGESEGAAGAGVSGVSGMNENRFRKRGAEGADKVAADAVGKAIAEQGAKDAAWCIPDSLLPMLAAVYCRDAERSRAVGAYGKQMRRLGAVAFRDAVGRFVHECEAGEMDSVRSRGALLLSRLKDAPGADG